VTQTIEKLIILFEESTTMNNYFISGERSGSRIESKEEKKTQSESYILHLNEYNIIYGYYLSSTSNQKVFFHFHLDVTVLIEKKIITNNENKLLILLKKSKPIWWKKFNK
jgi:hypothetical protein